MLKRLALPLVLLVTFTCSGLSVYADKWETPAEQTDGYGKMPRESAAARKATYRITMYRGDESRIDEIGYCSGVAIDERHVISAGHCAQHTEVEPDVRFRLDVFSEDGEESYGIELFLDRYNNSDLFPNLDLALFHTAQDIPFHIKLRYANPKVGDWLYNIGARKGESPYCIGWGQLASKTSRAFNNLWLCTIVSAPGASGSGVWNERGEFVGILVRGDAQAGLICIVPPQTVRDFIEGVNAKK